MLVSTQSVACRSFFLRPMAMGDTSRLLTPRISHKDLNAKLIILLRLRDFYHGLLWGKITKKTQETNRGLTVVG